MLTKTYPHLRLLVEPHTARDHPEFEKLVVVEKGASCGMPG
jgi:NADH kinase